MNTPVNELGNGLGAPSTKRTDQQGSSGSVSDVHSTSRSATQEAFGQIPMRNHRLNQARTDATPVMRRIARSLMGRVVSLRAGSGKTAHGIVTAVLIEGARPSVMVGGSQYCLEQVLTVTPLDLLETTV
jgi:hypothetical protein